MKKRKLNSKNPKYRDKKKDRKMKKVWIRNVKGAVISEIHYLT